MTKASKSKSASAPINKSRVTAFRTGATASFSALCVMERIANKQEDSSWQNGEVTEDGYFRDRELVKAALLNAAGPLSPFLEGFISTLAEYIDYPMQDGSIPNLYRWKPESMMTKREVTALRRKLFSDFIPTEVDQGLLLAGEIA